MAAPKMHAGMLDKVIDIEKRSQDQLPSGQRVDTWVKVATVYANIKPLVGMKYLVGQQLENELTHDITVRYQRYIRPSMRVLYLGRYFTIVSLQDSMESREWLYLKCKEEVLG